MKDYGTEFLTASRNKLKQLGYGDILTVSFSESGRPEIAWDMEIVREAIKSDDLTSIIKRVNQFERIYNNEYWFYSPQNKTPFDFAENAFTVFLRAQKSKLIKEGKVNRNLNVAYDYCKILEEKYNLDDLYINNYNPWFSARNVFLADVREEIQNGISVSDDERQIRYKAVVQSLLSTVLNPKGAMTSTQKPHITDFKGVVSVSHKLMPAPIVSAINPDYVQEMEMICNSLNNMSPGTMELKIFNGLGDFAEIMQGLYNNAQPYKINV